jgi:hypothetical protein
MNRTFRNTGAAFAVTVAMAACSGTPQTLTSPSAATGGSTTAAADGSTLKANAPALVAPINGARVDSLRPTLSWTGSSLIVDSMAPAYELEVSKGGTVVYNVTVSENAHQLGNQADGNSEYTWRVRARLDGAAGPWSGAASFQTPSSGGSVVSGFRAPDPAPGTRLPLPNESGLINDEYSRNFSDWQNSCQDRQGDRGWVWLDKLIDRLRTKDLRWGYNGKRGNTNDTSQDIVNYHYGAGDSNNSTQVYIIDVMFSHCGGSPSPAWIDQTSATAASGTIGRFIYPRVGRNVAASAGTGQ